MTDRISTPDRVRESCRQLRPILGPRIDKLLEAYIAEDKEGRELVERYIEILMSKYMRFNTDDRVQLLPPVTVIALLGVNASGLFVSIFLATLCSTIVAIIAARLYAKRTATI